MELQTINPTTGSTVQRFAPHGDADVERALRRAATAFPVHARTPIAQRGERLMRVAAILEQERRRWGELMTLEMGKPILAAVAEVEKCAWACRHYAEHAAGYLAPETVSSEAARSEWRYEPLGVVLAVMPWNFPFWQVLRFAAPALMAGNVALLKHAANVPQCALGIEDILRRGGFEEGVFQTLLVPAERVAGLIADPRVAAVTLTGSEGAGMAVGAAAGKALKKAVLELGGSDPFVVMPSADLARAAAVAVQARTINNGQSCIAAKRFIVHRQVAAEFESRFVAGMRALRVGDPMEEGVEIGPLATARIRDDLHAQVEASIAAGARLLCGGHPLSRPGFFYAPTVLAEAPPGSPAHDQELFGPVAALFRVDDLEAAIRLANATRFGLGAAVWTQDDRERDRMLREIEAGSVFVNGMVKSDPRLPFGGVKRSGHGRELGAHGIREFTNVKTVWVS